MSILEIIDKLNINISDKIFFRDMEDASEEYFNIARYKDYIYYIDINNDELDLFKQLEGRKTSPNIQPVINNLKDQLTTGRIFLTEHFRLHSVLYLHDYKLIKGSPFYIPVKTINDDKLCGYLEKQTILKNTNDFEIMFLKIYLSKKLSQFTPVIYSHEIMHTQLSSNMGSIENLYNEEILTIFVELLYGYHCNNENLNNSIINNRINDILIYYKNIIKYNNEGKIMDEDLVKNITFYISTITAIKLFIIYKNSSTVIKKEILSNIQKTLDNKRTLEDTLNIYNLDWSKKLSK